MLTGNYKILYERLLPYIGRERIFHDPLHTLALGTDASFYRLIPELVIRTNDETEICHLLRECSEMSIPVTFRAAGTSLSGQAITDSVLVIAGKSWKNYTVSPDGSFIRLQPGLTGGRVNAILAGYGRKIGPDPASLNAAMIGGIAANNASGMCCGTAQNTYRTVAGIRLVLADGTVLDTTDETSRRSFIATHSNLVNDISALSESVRSNTRLAGRIRHKYRMKNTTGYSLNALVDYTDPLDIIEHLMIGSEGTLAFISEINLATVKEYPFRATALMIFPDLHSACSAVVLLKREAVSAVELIDRAGLRSVENEKGMPAFLSSLEEKACALLIETTAESKSELEANITSVRRSVEHVKSDNGIDFTQVPSEYEELWRIRKGLFPSVGAVRRSGTTVIIEDVAFPVESLAEATIDLQEILGRNGYQEAVIFGHALEGNLHFVFTQDFSTPEETARYGKLMDEVAELVVNKYDGSLKAEHGTGRNMAPFVELEWGQEAYAIMMEIKRIFDPKGILNPGVILNQDHDIHLLNMKPMPVASTVIDKCTECGFCEPACVSADMTLTPRQRIAVYRDISFRLASGHEPHITASLVRDFRYEGDDTCATDGLCAMQCPVKIDTGKLIKDLRSQRNLKNESKALWMSERMDLITSSARKVLSVVHFFHSVLGTTTMTLVSKGLRRLSKNRIPLWNRYMPDGACRIKTRDNTVESGYKKVVYFPSCINRSMGLAAEDEEKVQLTGIMVSLLRKGGYQPVYPENLDSLCCGMAFLSKGYKKAGEKKSRELESALLKASRNGEYPVLCDMSPCLYTMRENMTSGLRLYEPVEFITEFLLENLIITPVDEPVTVFPVCSMKKMELDGKLADLARLCAREVIVPECNCCGFAGDRGFTVPELNRHGLAGLKAELQGRVYKCYSTSRTCEIGLSLHSGVIHKSIVYLVDRVASPSRHP